MRRILLFLCALLAVLALICPQALADATSKTSYEAGQQIVNLVGRLQIVRQSRKLHYAILKLDAPLDFLNVPDANGTAQNHMQQTEIQLLVPAKHNGRRVRVTGTLAGVAATSNPQRDCVLTNVQLKPIPLAKKVSMSKKASVNIGQTLQLNAAVKPSTAEQIVQWESNKTEVATVDANGLVTAVSKGTCTIIAKTTNRKKAVCKLTVTVPVDGVTLSQTTATIAKGKKLNLKATVSPANASKQAVTWSTSNAKVATVSKTGSVTAKAVGSATITVKTADGGFSASCAVTVGSGEVAPNYVLVDGYSIDLKVGESKQMTATVWPENATNKSVTWSSSNPKVASITSKGVITGIAPGGANITVTTVVGGIKNYGYAVVTSAGGGNDEPDDPDAPSYIWVNLPQEWDDWFEPMKTGQTHQARFELTPADADASKIRWSSSDTSVLSISATGLVTAKSPGVARIHCDTGYTYGGKPVVFNSGPIFVYSASAANMGAPDRVVTLNGMKLTVSLSTFDDVSYAVPSWVVATARHTHTGPEGTVYIWCESNNYKSPLLSICSEGDPIVVTARGIACGATLKDVLTEYPSPAVFYDEDSRDIDLEYQFEYGGQPFSLCFRFHGDTQKLWFVDVSVVR